MANISVLVGVGGQKLEDGGDGFLVLEFADGEGGEVLHARLRIGEEFDDAVVGAGGVGVAEDVGGLGADFVIGVG